jgi:hypothetical protein
VDTLIEPQAYDSKLLPEEVRSMTRFRLTRRCALRTGLAAWMVMLAGPHLPARGRVTDDGWILGQRDR